ncbi:MULTISPECIES: hypothetical protein [Asaia]|uniref:Uncharacterized protein n=2 Tax=Asaia TaxID=91914 RepID=A0ABQ1MAT6_9PROT|nr:MULTISPECIES: hypothetical protein [Asaia]GBR06337.1 hypothetical protein AA0323_1356 [Asaia siamensis NRIC 0323]GBR20976.1 hypothetical protein AA105894_2683 [Asaia spathodeae NBRC 105894]GGC34426.1 hypothetical protein GCM10007207_19960 [Asaia siamensis]
MTSAEAWDAGDYELADKLRHEQDMQDAIRAEIETQERRAQEAAKPRCLRERRG